jgi:SAM-dependent methyltransferase
MKRIRRVAALGDGPEPRKATSIALKHPNKEVVSVDISRKSLFGAYLKKLGLKEKPVNLTHKRGTDAINWLKRQKPSSLGHQYAHFLMQHMSFRKRQQLARQIFRTLVPGGRFVTVEDGHYTTQLKKELKQAGFEIYSREVSAKEVAKIGSNNADMNANHAIEKIKLFEQVRSLPKAIIRQMGFRDAEAMIENDRHEFNKTLEAKWKKQEGSNPSKESRSAIRTILSDSKKVYTKKPFVVIWAKKPRSK